MVSWPSLFTDFTLQQNPDLIPNNWWPPSETVNSNSSINYIIVNPSNVSRFYRLFKP